MPRSFLAGGTGDDFLSGIERALFLGHQQCSQHKGAICATMLV
jgi:hypothetical protein